MLGSNLISWSSKKQRAVARSSTKAEYRALATAASESLWILSLFTEIKFSLPQPPLLLCDNFGATNLSFNLVQHSRMKHIQIDLHFVRDLVQKNLSMFAMFTQTINLQTYSPNHFLGSTQISSSTRSVSPMGARSCGGVSRKNTLPTHVNNYCRTNSCNDRIHDSWYANHYKLQSRISYRKLESGVSFCILLYYYKLESGIS